MKIGFLGFGEAAFSIALGLNQEGAGDLTGYDILLEQEARRDQVLRMMAESRTMPAWSPEEAVSQARVIFSAVPADFAVDTARRAAMYLQKDSIYVDVTTASPEEKREIAELAEQREAKFADGAMMGPLLQYRHKVPMLLSGSGSQELANLMEPYHMNLTVVNELAGAATSMKFIRSITAKGLACLLFESLQAAQRFHVEDMIVDSICESYGSAFEKVIDGYISGTVIHAGRREHEMKNVVDFLRSADLPFEMAEATRGKLEKIAAQKLYERFEDGVPRNWKGVLSGWGIGF